MMSFWIAAILMVAVAMYFLLRPLLMNLDKRDIDRTILNADIAKERLNELKLELEQGVINKEEYDLTREELEQSLLYDVAQEQGENLSTVSTNFYSRISRTILMISIPVVAISFYMFLGSPDLIEGGKKQTATAPAGHGSSNGADKLATVEQMIGRLAAKLKENPDNAEGWFMLGRSYMSMTRYKEAVEALEKTNQLIPNNPVIMLRYADALTMLRGGQISGKPFDLIKRAVAIKPDDPTGLWLIGMGYEEQGEYSKAISYWNLLLPLVKDEKSMNEVKSLIKRAQNKAGISITENSVPATIASEKKSITSLKVSVSIDKSKLNDVSMDDTVFIFAKALNGPPMPLAVVRKKVKDLPLQVTLDDSMAMMPSMKLSSFIKVQVGARVSKSGNPVAESGDIQSKIYIVKPGQKEKVILIINKLLP